MAANHHCRDWLLIGLMSVPTMALCGCGGDFAAVFGSSTGGDAGTGGQGGQGTGGGGGAATGGGTAAGGGTGASGGAGAGGGVDPGIAPHCTGTPSQPTICLENVSGHAGETVDLNAHLMLTSGCHAGEYMGNISFDNNHFTLVNVTNGNTESECGRRDMWMGDIDWWHTCSYHFSSCPDYYSSGIGETFEIEISPNTPPGDYPFNFETPTCWIAGHNGVSFDATCDGDNSCMSGTLRVLP